MPVIQFEDGLHSDFNPNHGEGGRFSSGEVVNSAPPGGSPRHRVEVSRLHALAGKIAEKIPGSRVTKSSGGLTVSVARSNAAGLKALADHHKYYNDPGSTRSLTVSNIPGRRAIEIRPDMPRHAE